jgi:hypothetical protein
MVANLSFMIDDFGLIIYSQIFPAQVVPEFRALKISTKETGKR